jgi:magnesium chelatase family protein
MLARATAATPWGIEARPIQIEVDVRHGLPQTQIVGLPDTAVRESRERVRAAIKNCGFDLPGRAVTINLAPADLRKEGNHLDLGIALTLLAAHGELPQEGLEGRLCCGELGLDGGVRPIRGGLAIAELAQRLEVRELLLPAASAAEAAALPDLPVVGLDGLAEAIDHLAGGRSLPRARALSAGSEGVAGQPDLAEIRGQDAAKRALEIAAAGGHNLLLIGPPGSGKTMLARRMPGLLPALTRTEAITVTKIQSLGAPEPLAGLATQRPFRAPHTSISTAGLIGGGSIPRPGEVTLAHHGVLFLDELPEFKREALEALRQPLEDGEVLIARVKARLRFPARFALLAAMNPCKCGHLGDPRHECRCTPNEVERYRNRVSGPLLDRVDLHVEVPAVTLKELKGSGGESSESVAARVLTAREAQLRRLDGSAAIPVNAAMTDALLRRHCRLEAGAQKLLDTAFERLGLPARAATRILKVSRTIADLRGTERIKSEDIAEAIQYRTLDRRLAG